MIFHKRIRINYSLSCHRMYASNKSLNTLSVFFVLLFSTLSNAQQLYPAKISINAREITYFDNNQNTKTYGPPLVIQVKASDTKDDVMMFGLFPIGGPGDSQQPMCWDRIDDVLFTTTCVRFGHINANVAHVARWPVKALRPGLDLGAKVLDPDKLPQSNRWPSPTVRDFNGERFAAPSAVTLDPYHSITGNPFLRDMSPAFAHVSKDRIPDVFYDIRAVNGETIDLYLAVDGKISIWRFNGTDWKYIRMLPSEVKGVFRLCANGSAALTVHDDQWCVISLETVGKTKTIPIASVKSDELPWIVENNIAKETLFVSGRNVIDLSGKILETVPSAKTRSNTAKVEWISEFCRSRKTQD